MKLKFRLVIIIIFTIVTSVFIVGFLDYSKKLNGNLDIQISDNNILIKKDLITMKENLDIYQETVEETINGEVPSLEGLYIDEALAAVEKTNLSSQVISEYSSYYEKDIVFWQNLEAGKEIIGDEMIVFSISLGPENGEEPKDMVVVPLLIGMGENEATSKLIASGFTVEYEYNPNEDYKKGVVYSQNYFVDAEVAKGTLIKLRISGSN